MKHFYRFNGRSTTAQAGRCASVFCLIFAMLMTLGVGEMKAYNFYSPYIYFNNADLKWNPAMLFVGHGSYSCGYNQTSNPISDTKLVYFAPDASWSDQDKFTIGQSSNWGAESKSFDSRVGYMTHIGIQTNYGFNWHESYYVTGNTSGTINITSGRPGSLNATQGAKWRDTGTSYSITSGTWPATLNLQGTYLSGDGESSRSTITSTKSGDGSDKKTYGAVVTGLITHSYESLSSSYYFEGWGTGSTPSVTTATHSYNISAATTTYAFFSKVYTLSYDSKGTKGSSSISVSVANFSGTKTSGSSIPTGHTITVTASPATGYEVAGWYSDASCTSAYTSGSGVTISGSGNVTFTLASLNAASGIYCKFQKKTYSITLNDDGDYQGDGSATVQYGDAALTVSSHARRDGWNLVGYWNTSANQVTDAEGVLLTSVSGYTDGSGHWIYDGNATLYAHWSQTYSLTVAAGANVSSTTGSNADVTLNSKYAISATPNTGYRFSGWTASPSDNGVFDDATAASTNVTVKNGSVTVTGAATEIMRTITISGGVVYGGSATSTTAGVATSAMITANAPAAGKKFTGWSLGTGVSLKGGYNLTDRTIEIYSTANATVTAQYADRASVKMYFAKPTTLSWSKVYAYAWGASGHNNDYPGVELENTEVINCITYYTYQYYTEADGIGGAATGDATWNKIIFGDNDDARKTGDLTISNGHYYYRASSGTGKEAAITSAWGVKTSKDSFSGINYITHNCATNSGAVDVSFTGGNNYTFKVYNEVNDQWWSNSTAMGSTSPVTASMAAAQSLYNDDVSDMQVNAALTGSYTFTVGSTNASNPTIKVAFPEIYAIVGSFNSWNTATNPLSMDGNTGTADIVLAPSGSNYTLKVVDDGSMYGKNSTTITGTTTVSDLSTSGANINLTADIYPSSANPSYRFSYNKSTKALTVTYPSAHTVTYGVGTHAGTASVSSSISVASGKKVLDSQSITFSKGDTKTGYTWKGWYNNTSGSSSALGTGTTYTSSSRAANTSVYACYDLVNYTITYNLNGGSNPGGAPTSFTIESSAVTLPTPTKTGYTFNGWYENADLSTGGVKTTIAAASTGNKVYYAKWTANEYTITLNQNGATTESDPTSLTATYDATAPVYDDGASAYKFNITNPEKTGYTFAGWFESAGGTGAEIITTYGFFKHEDNPYVDGTGHWKNDGDVTVYAKWTPNEYAVTLSTSGETGYGSSAPSNQTATYGAALPTITPPVGATGYKFMGYFTGHNGSGTQYYNADGTSAADWNIAEETTLYAYFKKAAITSFTHNATLAKNETAYLVVNPTIVPADAEGVLGICWTLLYDNDNPVDGSHWSVAAETESGAKPYQVKYTLSNLENGTYKVQAVLKVNGSSFDACGNTGTELGTETTNFSIIGSTTVTVQYQDNSTGQRLQANGSVVVPAARSESVTAPSIVGYTFHHWVLGDGVTCESGTVGNENTEGTATITVSSDYDGYLTAKYNKKQMIYFNNTLGWDKVYVYFYNSGNYWGESNQGTGANTTFHNSSYTGKYGLMTRIGSSNIYYFDLAANSVSTSLTNVAFTDQDQNGADYFYDGNKVIGRGDYSATLSMYVPLAGVEPVEKNAGYTAYYYEKGYWMNYPESTGYTLYIFNTKAANGVSHDEIKHIPFTFTEDKAMPLSVTTDLEAGHTYGVKIKRADNSWYGNAGTMTNGHSGDEGQPVWEFKSNVESDCGLTTSGAGDYTFTLSFGLDVDGTNYNYHVGVHFPESTGDFRVQYKDNDHTNWRTSSVIPKGTEADTVSYYVRKAQTPYIRVQKCTATWDDEKQETTVTWNNENLGNNIISSLPSAITADGVYNFIFKKSNGALVLDKVEPYSGNYYIRVDGAGSSNWDNFRAADHLMTYSEYADKKENFTHSFTTWRKVTDREHLPNVKFVVANDYSVCISDTITQDGIADAYVDANGYLNRDANIRYMYNYKTNAASRAYIDGAQEDDSEFLMLIPSNNTSLYDASTAGTAYTQVKFKDNGNWIYEANVWAVPGTTYKLKSSFGKESSSEPDENGVIVQYFKGAAEGSGEYVTLVGGNDAARLNIRLVYDFKYNRLVTAYVPSSTISSDKAIHADIMFIREHQGDMTQITFTNNAKITDIENVYCALKFNKWTLNNRSKEEGHAALSPSLSRYERDLFYVSFPYDVKVSDIIGFGTYGTHWIIEYYDGADRAEKGFWADSKPFWKFVTPSMKNTFTLKAGTGYIVALDLDELYYTDNTHHSAVWDNTDVVELLFPGNVSSISSGTVTYNMPQHTCTINRNTPGGDRTKKDSHWNILGVPTYHNLDAGVGVTISGQSTWEAQYPKFIYQWNKQDNSLTAVSASGFDYKAMHAYMVQYAGNVTFNTSSSPSPSPVIARELYLDAPQEIEFRVELLQDGAVADQTFVSMSNDEQVSAHFVFGEDMSKEFNKDKANIYTFIGTEQAAGNTLPMTEQTTLVPVGVKIAANDDYTFSIPEGTEGVGVTLIDKERGTRTNLSAVDYTVSLEAGTYDERFMLEFSPIHNAPTGTEQIQGDDGQSTNTARKVLIDGLLYIVRDNIIYDARGARVE